MVFKFKYLLLVGFCLLFFDVSAQLKRGRKKLYSELNSKRPDENDRFLNTQWWLGFRAGANLTKAEPTQFYSSFSPVNYSLAQKEYDEYEIYGGQAGIEITFYHKGFSFSLQPNYRRNIFGYTNSFSWSDAEQQNNTIELNYYQSHRLDYLEIPLFIKYDLTKGAFRPFVQVGAFYAALSGAEKEVEVTGTDYASGGAGPFEKQTESFGVDALFINSSLGLAGGIGFSFDRWNTRIVGDVTYRHGMHNVTNVKTRYTENPMSGIGDAMDDMELRNITFNLGVLFPLRFISKGYNAVK